MMSTPSPDSREDIGDFGFHYDLQTVQLAAIALNRFHVLPFPGGFFDQPIELIFDVLRYLNISDFASDKTFYGNDTDIYEEQSIDNEIKGFKF
jgi:hypothetical protein